MPASRHAALALAADLLREPRLTVLKVMPLNATSFTAFAAHAAVAAQASVTAGLGPASLQYWSAYMLPSLIVEGKQATLRVKVEAVCPQCVGHGGNSPA